MSLKTGMDWFDKLPKVELHLHLEGAIPYDALEPMRHKLSKVHYGDSGGNDRGWEEILADQLGKAVAGLEVVISEFPISLDELISFSPGEIISIGADENTPVTVVCEKSAMFRAATGQKNNGKSAVKITEILEIEKG